MTEDILFFIDDAAAPVTSNALNQPIPGEMLPHFNVIQYAFSIFIVGILVYATLLILKIIQKNRMNQTAHLLKEIQLSATFKMLYIKVHNSLYLVAKDNASMLLLDKITDEEEILAILTEPMDDERKSFSLARILGLTKKQDHSFKTKLEKTIHTVLKNSDEIEELKKP